MKKLIYITLAAAAALLFASCNKITTANQSWITEYVRITLEGDRQVILGVGDVYTEPGYSASEQGIDVTAGVQVSYSTITGDPAPGVATDAANIYTVNYTAVNKDGYSWTEQRKVIVGDGSVTETLAGDYKLDPDASNNTKATGVTTYTAYAANYAGHSVLGPYVSTDITITIKKVAANIYSVSDFVAGWYASCIGYGGYYLDAGGPSYAGYWEMDGFVTLNADNSISHVYSHIPRWDDGLDGFIHRHAARE